jgi:methyltransferase (TIGR00027 family)
MQDRPSNTAVYVAMGRALAEAEGGVRGFSDPFALRLLPDDCRAVVERTVRGEWPRDGRDLQLRIIARAMAPLMGPRTVEIDEGLRELPSGHQVVILGAGLDARAYRLRELAGSVVFEVDHPASQAFKRERTAGLVPCARELRYVPVDFTRERLEDALARAGHATDVPTAWVFEGVISYLTRREVGQAVEGMATRSAPGSRLLATYNEPGGVRRVFAAVTARAGEPHRASFTPARMRQLLEQRGFVVRSDRDGVERARRTGRDPSALERVLVRFHHVVIADRR